VVVVVVVLLGLVVGLGGGVGLGVVGLGGVVLVWGLSQRELVERARDAGALAYLVKPFSISDLIPAIELAVSRFREISALEEEVATLSDRLETRKAVERAKGLLQTKHKMSEPEAFKWIQRAAMDRRTTMKHVAEVVLETLDAPEDAAPAG
jgi:response regulator NasT